MPGRRSAFAIGESLGAVKGCGSPFGGSDSLLWGTNCRPESIVLVSLERRGDTLPGLTGTSSSPSPTPGGSGTRFLNVPTGLGGGRARNVEGRTLPASDTGAGAIAFLLTTNPADDGVCGANAAWSSGGEYEGLYTAGGGTRTGGRDAAALAAGDDPSRPLPFDPGVTGTAAPPFGVCGPRPRVALGTNWWAADFGFAPPPALEVSFPPMKLILDIDGSGS